MLPNIDGKCMRNDSKKTRNENKCRLTFVDDRIEKRCQIECQNIDEGKKQSERNEKQTWG